MHYLLHIIHRERKECYENYKFDITLQGCQHLTRKNYKQVLLVLQENTNMMSKRLQFYSF